MGNDRSVGFNWPSNMMTNKKKKRVNGNLMVELGVDWELGGVRRVDNKAGDKRYLLWIDNLNSLKCIRISLRDCRAASMNWNH